MTYTRQQNQGTTWVGVSAALEPTKLTADALRWKYTQYQIRLERGRVTLVNGYICQNQYVLWVPLTEEVRKHIKDELIEYEPPE